AAAAEAPETASRKRQHGAPSWTNSPAQTRHPGEGRDPPFSRKCDGRMDPGFRRDDGFGVAGVAAAPDISGVAGVASVPDIDATVIGCSSGTAAGSRC